jgi:predicted TPR repeat methyltransferase
VTVDEAVRIAVDLQSRGRLDEAARIFDAVLSAVPTHAHALHYSGVLAHQQGRGQDAADRIRRSLELDPEKADYHNNLGIVLRHLGRLDEAIEACHRALELDDGHANARSNLGVLLGSRGELDEAERELRRAVGLDPQHADALTNLGALLSRRGRTREAVLHLCRAMVARPAETATRTLLIRSYALLGDMEAAQRLAREWLAESPDDPIALHTLAAVSGREVPERASDAYVERVFDRFADAFEANLESLSYRAPAVIVEVLKREGPPPSGNLDVLDAGCGTGLCGPELARWAERLVGVDLSGRMLARAREKGVYDELVREELTAFMESRPGAFDLIVSADTLVYFGALESVVDAVTRALRPGGSFVFTVEEATGSGPADTFHLRLHGRYAHTRAYVERLFGEAGFAVEVTSAQLRMEAGEPVAGLAVRASAPGG